MRTRAGAQTLQLALRNPKTSFVAIDRSVQSLDAARERVEAHKLRNVEFRAADVHDLPFEDGEFDAVFVCFVLEHLADRERALSEMRRVLRTGGCLQVFEGDHGSVLAWPDDPAIGRLVDAVSRYQRLQGGEPDIGRGLCPVLIAAGFRNVRVEPCVAYADVTRPAWVEAFTQRTFIDMMLGQRDAVLERGLLSDSAWRAGIDALKRTMSAEGSFSYTFFRAIAER
jgi:SAM-dependent methyltransferase